MQTRSQAAKVQKDWLGEGGVDGRWTKSKSRNPVSVPLSKEFENSVLTDRHLNGYSPGTYVYQPSPQHSVWQIRAHVTYTYESER